MSRRLPVFVLITLAAVGLRVSAEGTAPPVPTVGYAELDGTVNPGSADYLERAIKEAPGHGFSAIVIRVDTPGGELEATRRIVKAELASTIPVVVWVGPTGARAGSAGVFVTMAAHVAAMAPATNIGAAHPVSIGMGGGEEKPDETMKEKITNDTSAWAEGIATERGRNAEWAKEAVEESASVPAEKAVELKVVDLIAADLPTLLKQIDGREVRLPAGKSVISSAGAVIKPVNPTPTERLLDGLGNPSVAMLLLSLGALGILAELYHPGTIFPGALGASCLAIGLLAARMLPVRAGSIVLLLVGTGLMAAEFYATSYGLFAVAGLVCFALGAFLLINPSDPGYLVDQDFGVQWSFVAPILLTVAAILGVVVWKVVESRRVPPMVGSSGLVGQVGELSEDAGPQVGLALLRGELWQARSAQLLPKGTKVRVKSVDGLVATVEKVE